jgi:hypothetical protein
MEQQAHADDEDLEPPGLRRNGGAAARSQQNRREHQQHGSEQQRVVANRGQAAREPAVRMDGGIHGGECSLRAVRA